MHTQISAPCNGVRTLTAELGLSGRARGERLRGRVIAGFERPASMRLEGVAPIGEPVFILAARGDSGTLLFPRDDRILQNAPPEEILAELTGVDLAPADLQAILTGCVLPAARPTGGRLHANGWASIALEPASGGGAGATIYLRRDADQWRLAAARRDAWQLEYPAWQGAFPQAVRLASGGAEDGVDLTATVSQMVTNMPIDPAAFTIAAPADAAPITLEELRRAGPLRGN